MCIDAEAYLAHFEEVSAQYDLHRKSCSTVRRLVLTIDHREGGCIRLALGRHATHDSPGGGKLLVMVEKRP